RTHGTSCSAGNFGLAELGVCALSKTYLEQLTIGELIGRPLFCAPTLNPITPPGVLPTQAGTQLERLSALEARSSLCRLTLRRVLQSRCSAAAMSRSDPERGHHRREKDHEHGHSTSNPPQALRVAAAICAQRDRRMGGPGGCRRGHL